MLSRSLQLWRWAVTVILSLVAIVLFAQTVDTVKDLELPLERDENDKVTLMLTAATASIPSDGGPIQATGVKVESFNPDGSLEMYLKAVDCMFSKRKGRAASDSKIILEKEGVVITGTGFTWDADNKEVKILKDAKVVINKKSRKLNDK